MKTLNMRSAPLFIFMAGTSMIFNSCASGSTEENPNGILNALKADMPTNVIHASMINTPSAIPEKNSKKKIKIALLLDTSNSMDGLIEQAKSQLWKIVNELSSARCNDEKPELEIALYEYGNDGLPSREGYIRQVSLFTHDLDLISEKLFSLTTNGGNEFCGQVIRTSLDQLNWSTNGDDLQIIFIAGNEAFSQGEVNYHESCSAAKEKKIVVNTIFCGQFDEGLSSGWKDGSQITGGEYMSIEQNRKTVYIESPYDKDIALLNEKLNATYVGYGKLGYSNKQNQATQDMNARKYGNANITDRVVSKSSSFYSNSSWDLVDATTTKEVDVTKLKESELPAELKGKSKEEKEKYIQLKSEEREQVKKQIAELNTQRMKFIAEKAKTTAGVTSLDAAMINAIKLQAGKKNFVF